MLVARALVGVVVLCGLVHADPGEDAARKKLRAMRAYTLTEELSLDEPTAAKLFPLLARFDLEGDKLAARRTDVQLRLLATTDKTDRKIIDALVDESLATTRWQRDLEDRRFGELRKVLAPSQIAKIVVLLPDLDAQVAPHVRLRAPTVATTPGDDDDAPMQPPAKPAAKKCNPFDTRGSCR